MQRLSEKHTFGTTDRALRFLRLRLVSRPATKAMVREVSATRQRLRDTQEAWLESREERIAQSAEVEYCDDAVNAVVMNLSREVLVLVEGKRTDPRFVLLFPVAAGEMVADVGGDTQAHHVRTLIRTLRTSADFSAFARHADTIEAKFTALEEAVKARDALYVAEAMALAKRNAVLADAKRYYNGLYPRLLILLDDKALTESLFAKLHKASKSKQDSDDNSDEQEDA